MTETIKVSELIVGDSVLVKSVKGGVMQPRVLTSIEPSLMDSQSVVLVFATRRIVVSPNDEAHIYPRIRPNQNVWMLG